MYQPSTDSFEQGYNAQIVVDQESLLIVGESLSNHPTDQHEAEPTLDASADSCTNELRPVERPRWLLIVLSDRLLGCGGPHGHLT